MERRVEDGAWVWEPTFRHNDHLGGTQVATDRAGLATFQEYYTPYGEVENASPLDADRVGFTGHIRDHATGLLYMQARYYSPVAGRMLSVDSVDFAGSGGDARYVNRYMYAGNDPVGNSDPDGKQICGYLCRDLAKYGKLRQVVRNSMKATGRAALTGVEYGAGVGIIVADAATIPSGEGLVGVGVMRAAVTTACKDAAVGATVAGSVDLGVQLDASGGDLASVDLRQTGEAMLGSVPSSIVGGLGGRTIDKGLEK